MAYQATGNRKMLIINMQRSSQPTNRSNESIPVGNPLSPSPLPTTHSSPYSRATGHARRQFQTLATSIFRWVVITRTSVCGSVGNWAIL